MSHTLDIVAQGCISNGLHVIIHATSVWEGDDVLPLWSCSLGHPADL